MKPSVLIDMFCGGGGESCGLVEAFTEADQKIELHAINHWERAIETHAINHPQAEHHLEPIQNLNPLSVVPGRRAALLWASPECTHHSNAAGGRPKNEQSRASAWLILKWLQELYVDRLIVENVPEFLNWGPLGADGKTIKSMKGHTFIAWKAAIASLGYKVEARVLNAANYGAPTTRQRLFVQAVRSGKKILWPDPSHTFAPDLFARQPWRTARECIDWSIPSPSIFTRSRPLVPKTMRRIEAGIKKYWKTDADAFFAILRGTSVTARLDVPCPTVTAGGGHLGLVSPFVIGQQSCAAARPVSRPMPTVATAGAISLCQPFLTSYYGASTKAQSLREPMNTVTTRDRFGLVAAQNNGKCLDIGFRMLQPHELAAAQSFPAGYRFAGTKKEQVKQIGNAVPPKLAYALASSYTKSKEN